VRLLWLVLLVPLTQALPQNPSPMSDTTRPHPRVERYDVPGQRAALSIGTVYLSPGFEARARHPLVIHLHGAPWLIEHHLRERAPQAVLVTVQLGGGSRGYAEEFADPGRFNVLVMEAASRASELAGGRVAFESIALSSFSAGYGGVRSILRHADHYTRVGAVTLADSLHASYVGDGAIPRAADLPVDETGLDVFIRFAADAGSGSKRMWVTHSEVYPGTYASTTETADVLLKHLKLTRVRALRDGPIGMQQLSEARRGNFHLAGFAGNSAPDHMDHLYALGAWLERGDRQFRSVSWSPASCSYTDSRRSKNERYRFSATRRSSVETFAPRPHCCSSVVRSPANTSASRFIISSTSASACSTAERGSSTNPVWIASHRALNPRASSS
jgi:hypothetical protein